MAAERAGKPYSQLRQLVLHRDGPTCRLCGRICRTTGNPNHPHYYALDHIRPLADAVNDQDRYRLLYDPTNCRVTCRRCNTARGTGASVHIPVTNPLDGW